ncbi:hypothetical protein N9A45_01515, partial [bacterium]|nr:hypothetical protein [bacterium]
APTIIADRQCTELSPECDEETQYEQARSLHLNRRCVDLTVCTASQYETLAPTLTTNRVCTDKQMCQAGSYVAFGGNATSDRVCEACTEGYTDAENQTSCSPWTSCGAGRLQGQLPTNAGTCADCSPGTWAALATDDCQSWSLCTLGETYQTQAPNATSDRVCVVLTTCDSSQYEYSEPTLEKDRECQKIDTCPTGQYLVAEATEISNVECKAYTDCQAGSYVAFGGNATSDRVCEACTEGYTDAENQTSCSPWTSCGAGRLQGQLPTNAGTCADCSGGTWAALATDDCQPWTACTEGETYQTQAPTKGSNRECGNVTTCSDKKYASVAATMIADTFCHDWRTCPEGTYVSVQPNATHDRSCTICENGFSNTENAESCTGWRTTCDGDFYVNVNSGGVTLDRDCKSPSTCSHGKFEVFAPQGINDRVCSECDEALEPMWTDSNCGNVCSEVCTHLKQVYNKECQCHDSR